MIACPHPPCEVTREAVGQMTAHLVEQHLIAPHVALKQAREAAQAPPRDEISTVPDVEDPTQAAEAVARTLGVKLADPMQKKGITPPPTKKKEAAVASDICGYCKHQRPDHSKNCKYRGGCKRCAKRAPDKCPLHGGTHLRTPKGAKVAHRGGHGKSKPTSRRAVRNGGPPATESTTTGAKSLLRTHLLQEKADLEAELKVIDRLLARASG